ncbi:MAG: AbrB/MazE/SpoVT family DNA-binding domain-containing protein [bacterium]|nr:AbrB/MazE/SpoVT family DNA-binding domain-containing protein [bacterium]
MKNQTTIDFVKLMDRGMMVIPIRLRNELGLKKGDYITAVMRDDQIVLTPHIVQEDTQINRKRTLIARKPLISKEEGLKILSKKTKKPLWNDEDMKFYQEGRDMIEKRLQEYDKI